MGYTILTDIWQEVDSELQRQRVKHGTKCMEQRSTHDAIAPLTEELGEVAQAECDHFDGRTQDGTLVRKELIQLAASAIAMVRHIDAEAQPKDLSLTVEVTIRRGGKTAVIQTFGTALLPLTWTAPLDFPLIDAQGTPRQRLYGFEYKPIIDKESIDEITQRMMRR